MRDRFEDPDEFDPALLVGKMTGHTWNLYLKSPIPRRMLLGEALLELTNGLRGLGATLDETLPPVSNQLSAPLDKIVLPPSRLLRCISNATLPPLKDSTTLIGDCFELFEPIVVGVGQSPRNGAPGTRLEIDNRGIALPLHGLGYDRSTAHWTLHDPWDTTAERLALSEWLEQPLVQVNKNRVKTIREVLKHVRDKRGAHADPNWISEVPQPLRAFFELYAGSFLVEFACLLVNEAAASASADSVLAAALFPEHRDPTRALRVPQRPGNMKATIERISLATCRDTFAAMSTSHPVVGDA